MLLLLPINILTSVIYTTYFYKNDKTLIIKGIDDKLITAAYGFKFFTDSYHDKIAGSDSISREQYLEVIKKLGEFSDNTRIEAAYSMIVSDGKIFFTSDSATSATDDAKAAVPVQFYDNTKTPARDCWRLWKIIKCILTRTPISGATIARFSFPQPRSQVIITLSELTLLSAQLKRD